MKLFSLFIIVMNGFFVDAMHGGEIGKIEQVPHMAEISKVYENGADFCGAAILSNHWILTAAHCVQSEVDLVLRQVRVKTSKTLGEEARGSNPIMFDEKSQSIAISKKTPKAGQVINISGYGFDNHVFVGDLKLGQQTVISNEACKKAYERAPQSNITIDNRVFCTDSTLLDVCSGDSGSPVVMNGKLVGVAAEGCESPLPNIYVNVAHYYGWIRYVTGLEF